MQDLKKYLSAEQPDYNEGLLLFSKYSKNRILAINLARKHMPSKLAYELQKLAKTPNKIIIEAPSKIISTVDNVNQFISGKPIVKVDDLSAELKVLWFQNTEYYRIIRSLHEKCKLEQDATKRSELLTEIEERRQVIFKNWSVIDGKSPTEKVVIDENRINANRKYLSEGKKKILRLKGVAFDRKLLVMQGRLNELLSVNAEITPLYKEELQHIGLKFD